MGWFFCDLHDASKGLKENKILIELLRKKLAKVGHNQHNKECQRNTLLAATTVR